MVTKRPTPLRPAYSRILQRLRAKIIDMWANHSLHQYSPAERATKLLIMAVEELRHKPYPNERGIELLSDIRYAIFNYVPWKQFKSRTTVSYFNLRPAITGKEKARNQQLQKIMEYHANDMQKEVDNRIDRYRDLESHTLIIDGKIKGVTEEVFRYAWKDRWQSYLSAGEEPNSFPSWNDFLLNYAKNPVNMGIVWKSMDRLLREIDGDYALDESFSEMRPFEVYKSSLKDFLEAGRNRNHNEAITYIRQMRELCSPKPEIKKTRWASDEALLQTLLSLYWGFGIWGADSFISLPVTYASSSPNHTGILSLGSIYPLSSYEIAEWTLIANCVIGTLLNLEAEERIISSTTNYTYRVGHPFKNRSNSIASFTTNLIADFHRLLYAYDQGDRTPEIREKLERHRDKLELLEINSTKLTGFGSLVNFLSALSQQDDVWSDKRAQRWLTEEPVNIRKLFESLGESSFHQGNSRLRLKLVFDANMENLYFACRVNSDNQEIYLGKELLSAIFYELTINAIQHGKPVDNEVELYISACGDGEIKQLSLTNIMGEHLPQETKNVSPYDINGAGGETLAGHILASLVKGAPKLTTGKYEENGKYYFQYAVSLPVMESS
uniref:Uncharacterized protein n=1 Tax=Candidatus Kentrum sp. DK TaxID=2126562 RepID=A0A450SZ12_9GAMM|nr:MAG: hypothetical protein BECKDK2373C_GA0170839_107116 [Candidatus Kentron sp. DK]